MIHFYFGIPYLGKVQTDNKINDLLQCGINDLMAASNYPKAQDRALPKILIATFGHRDIELV